SEFLTKPIDRDRLARVLRKYGRRDGGPRRVLVVDDDPQARAVLRRAMEAEGWSVSEAEHGRAALEQALGAVPLPDLVLLDLMIPEMNGFEFLEAVRKHESWRAVPVVVITAMDLTDDDRRRLNGGVERVVAKGGLGLDALAATVRDHVTHRP